jgi:hypothetical protein
VHTAVLLDEGLVEVFPPAGGAVTEQGDAGGDTARGRGRVQDSGPDRERGPLAMFGTLTGIATLTAVLVVGGAAAGLLVDRATGAPHVFVFLGLVGGVVVAILAVRSIVRRFFG